QRGHLDAWCESVGPALVAPGAGDDRDVDVMRDGLVVVTWNVHEGAGDLARFLATLRPSGGDRAAAAAPAVVVLAQEAVRGSNEIPVIVPAGVKAPRRIGRPDASGDIVSAAAQLHLWLAYVPSMRNGADAREDRGSAILSTLPLSEVVAVVLPWANQRRVAVMATVTTRQGAAPLRLRVMSVHLDNRPSRVSQAAALARFIGAFPADAMP